MYLHICQYQPTGSMLYSGGEWVTLPRLLTDPAEILVSVMLLSANLTLCVSCIGFRETHINRANDPPMICHHLRLSPRVFRPASTEK